MDGKVRILVVKLGALGDFVQALGPFAAIRRHHRDAWITLLTTAPYAELAYASGYFDEIWIDPRSRLPRRLLALRKWLRAAGFKRVYDLQTSDRSAFYFRLFWPGPFPEWSGIAKGCSHPHANPQRDAMHTLDRQAEQLRMAGIEDVPPPDLAWAKPDVAKFGLAGRYALLAAGGAPHRPAKRWPAERFAELAGWLAGLGFKSLIADFDHWVAFILLAFIGGRMIVESRRDGKSRRQPARLGWMTMLGLALATSIDALAVGLSFSALRADIVLPALLIGAVTFVLSLLAAIAGRRFGARLAGRAELLGGLILVAIGVRILIEHLRAG